MFERSLLLVLVVGSLVLPACGDDSGGDGDGSEGSGASAGSGVPAEDCPERCADKAASCGAPADLAAAQCQGVCGGILGEDELECLEDEDCATLEQAFLGSGGACDLGGGSASGGSASGGSASGGNPNSDIGDACECSGTEVSFESCSGTDSSCGALTCYVFASTGDGICSQSCTSDIDGDDCPQGECVDHLIAVGVSVGVWCEP